MSTPLEATRSAPISTTIRDCLVHAWVVSNETAPNDAGAWMIDVGGHETVGPMVDRARDESMQGVKDMLRQWAKEHPSLFD
jgi:hypothetical protein